MAIEEFNNFGLAAVTSKMKIDKGQSNLMFGFKAPLGGASSFLSTC